MFILKIILIIFTILIISGLFVNRENDRSSYIATFYECLILLYLLFS